MTINRRRAASSKISRDKKLGGHKNEEMYASLIEGEVIKGVQKGDVKDSKGLLHSVKSGKKWQVFLYGRERIASSKYLNILESSLNAFPLTPEIYFIDRTRCIEYKEDLVRNHGRLAAKEITNKSVSSALGKNEYIQSKHNLAKSTKNVCDMLTDKEFLRSFLSEAIFNGDEVSYLAAKDSSYLRDNFFKVFDKEDVLDILTKNLFPAVSRAGFVPEDFNVKGQKTLLCYRSDSTDQKNIVEIEIRNDSPEHYRQVRFNMYSKDALRLLLDELEATKKVSSKKNLIFFGRTTSKFS